MPIMGDPTWIDDFFGVTIDPRYVNHAVKGSASIQISQGTSLNGIMILETNDYNQADCYIRLGESPGFGADVRNWNPQQNIVYETRVFYNTNNFMQSSIGFVGAYDPTNFMETYYYAPGNAPSTWQLCVTYNNSKGTFIDTGFTHTPGMWFVLRLTTIAGSPYPTYNVYINDNLVASYTGAMIPLMQLVPEYNLFNFPMGSGFSNPALWVDYLYITQIRQ